jgi:acetyl esterase/lipase
MRAQEGVHRCRVLFSKGSGYVHGVSSRMVEFAKIVAARVHCAFAPAAQGSEMVTRRNLLRLAALTGLAGAQGGACAAQSAIDGWPSAERYRIWPGDAPGGAAFRSPAPDPGGNPAFLRGIREPELHVFRAPRPDGRALLVTPGGAYLFVSVANEGVDIARWFNPRGVTVLVLAYRLPCEGWAPRHDVPLQDAQRALRWARANATRLDIDPRRLGVLGFSAGGHLAASLAVSHAERVYEAIDAIDQQSARPDFAGLIYPVISMAPGVTHALSRANLLGDAPPAALVAARSPDLQVGPGTPRCFLAHGIDDDVVPVENALRMTQALRAAGRPVEAHFFESAPHAFSLGIAGSPSEAWPGMFLAWSALAGR